MGIIDWSSDVCSSDLPALQDQALDEVLHADWTDEPMSAREAADHIQENYMLDLKRAPFPIVDANLVDQAGACTSCTKRTGSNRSEERRVGNECVSSCRSRGSTLH